METDLTQERQRAHRLLDLLPEDKFAAVYDVLKVMVEPLPRSLASTPVKQTESTPHS
jgi:hypothetical protein